jgi:lysophospholipid acyltransferase (LPLAT)-like uncharacterized protein
VVRLMDLVLRLLSRTWRIDVVEGEEAFAEVIHSDQPVIFCFWHNRIIPAAGLLLRRVVPAGKDVTLVSSPSKDGELSARFLKIHGGRVVRGSSSRGGSRALRGVLKVTRRHGSSPILIPDGPKGPVYHFKQGVLGMSQITGSPILNMGFAAERSKTLGTWDRMVFPRPFSRIAVTVDPLQGVPKGLSDEELEAERRRLEERLEVLNRTAEAAVGAEDPWTEDSGRPV